MTLLAIGLNHDTAPVALRERLAVAESELSHQLQDVKAATGADESMILSTCNRTEVILAGEASQTAMLEWLAQRAEVDPERMRQHVYCYQDVDAARHLMRVAAGLDSLVIGEPQIFGQLKTALGAAKSAGAAGSLLNQTLQSVFGAAKRVRTQTEIGKEPVSVAFAAVKLAEQVFDPLSECNAVLLGAGETCALVGRHLNQRGIGQLTVVNRGLGRAQDLASDLSGRAMPLTRLGDALEDADILVCSTAAPLPLVGKGMVERALKHRRRPILIIDVAVPRDVEPEVDELADAYLYTVDDLREVIDRGKALRAQASQRAELIIDAELENLVRDQAVRAVGNHVAELRARGQAQAEQALTKALARIRNGESNEVVMARLAHELTQKLLHEPSKGLRHVATHPEQLDTALTVLGLKKGHLVNSGIERRLEQLLDRFEEVQALMSDPDVISDQQAFAKLGKEYSDLEVPAKLYQQWRAALDDLEQAKTWLDDSDPDLKAMAREELPELQSQVETLDDELTRALLPKDPDDDKDVYLEVRAGTGGDEAALFAGDLFRMYSKYAESQRWKIKS